MEATPGNLALMATARRLGRELGLGLGESMAGGMSDANTTSLYTPTLDRLGPIGDGAHARHEFIYEETLVDRAALLTLLLATPTDPSMAREAA
jgi:glutamate carboxypeptidase